MIRSIDGRVSAWKANESHTRRSPWRPKPEMTACQKNGPSAEGSEAPRPSKFELPCAGYGGPTRLTKSPKLQSFRVARGYIATGEAGGRIIQHVTLPPPRSFIPSGAGFSSNTASSIFSRGQIRANIRDAASRSAVFYSLLLFSSLARARSMSPVGRVFIGPFAATDSGPSSPRRWFLPVQLSESEQY
jgi:hypothetical protein